jgi:hypothetical protein
MAARKDLGTLLVEEKVISSADLERARKQHREQGGRLLDHLLALSLTTEGDVFKLLGGRAGIAAVPENRLGAVHVPLSLRRVVPRALAEQMRIVPLELSSDHRTLSVVASDPTDESALEAVRRTAGVEAVRAYLGKRTAVLHVIIREYPLEEAAPQPSSKIELDPELAREIAQLKPDSTSDKERTPKLSVVPPAEAKHTFATTPQKPERAPTPADVQLPLDLVHRTASEAAARIRTQPPKTSADKLPELGEETTQVRRAPQERAGGSHHRVRSTVDEEARTPIPEVMRAADERHHQVLSQTIGLLVDLAETALAGTRHARELGRWARRVAREMGLAERTIAEIGLAAELYALDRTLREVGEEPPDFVGTFGWAAGAPDGLAPMLRALVESATRKAAIARAGAKTASGSQPPPLARLDRTSSSGAPLGARIVLACEEVLRLRGETAGSFEMAQVAEVLQAHSTPIEVIEAIERVLGAERAARAAKAQNEQREAGAASEDGTPRALPGGKKPQKRDT